MALGNRASPTHLFLRSKPVVPKLKNFALFSTLILRACVYRVAYHWQIFRGHPLGFSSIGFHITHNKVFASQTVVLETALFMNPWFCNALLLIQHYLNPFQMFINTLRLKNEIVVCYGDTKLLLATPSLLCGST